MARTKRIAREEQAEEETALFDLKQQQKKEDTWQESKP